MTELQSETRIFVLQAMVSMAAADGRIALSETETICALYAELTGERPTIEEIATAPDAYRARGLTFADILARERARLTREAKETILRSAYTVLLADGRVGARERKKLADFANALKISEIHRGVIFEDVERTLH
ncbi:MAG: TerB family tellurite resistance protein [Hyphomicrobiales bacterium]|nr:TerB family tellurite resistance protein [Hyphomicrobiales bacterium]